MSRGVVGGTGLGFGDLARTMKVIEAHHRVMVTLAAQPEPTASPGLRWSVCAQSLDPSGQPENPFEQPLWVVEWVDTSPDTSATASRLYRALLDLDVVLTSERWEQTPLAGL